jgi:hypothetical protein
MENTKGKINLRDFETVFTVVANFYGNDRNVTFREVAIAALDRTRNRIIKAEVIQVRPDMKKLRNISRLTYNWQKYQCKLPNVSSDDSRVCDENEMTSILQDFITSQARAESCIVHKNTPEIAELIRRLDIFIPVYNVNQFSDIQDIPSFPALYNTFGSLLSATHACDNHVFHGNQLVWKLNRYGKLTLISSSLDCCALSKVLQFAIWLGTDAIHSHSVSIPMSPLYDDMNNCVYCIE